jgi:hypothetical protein
VLKVNDDNIEKIKAKIIQDGNRNLPETCTHDKAYEMFENTIAYFLKHKNSQVLNLGTLCFSQKTV